MFQTIFTTSYFDVAHCYFYFLKDIQMENSSENIKKLSGLMYFENDTINVFYLSMLNSFVSGLLLSKLYIVFTMLYV